jgi:D-amino peptidase
MKVYISTDFEGVAGIVDWDQIMVGSHDYELGRRLLLGELNAAIEGAESAGATEFVVNDSHSSMRSLEPDRVSGRATLITGKYKPLYMMEGLDASFDAIFFLGYHGSVGASQSVLSHTYNPRAIWDVRINGQIVGESALNALVAAHAGVPIALVTGDAATASEARDIVSEIETVEVKRSVSRYAAESLHPEVARERIHAGAHRAVERLASIPRPSFPTGTTIEVTFLTADMAEMACWLRGVALAEDSTRTVRFGGDDPLVLFQTFVTMVYLTRAIVEQ